MNDYLSTTQADQSSMTAASDKRLLSTNHSAWKKELERKLFECGGEIHPKDSVANKNPLTKEQKISAIFQTKHQEIAKVSNTSIHNAEPKPFLRQASAANAGDKASNLLASRSNPLPSSLSTMSFIQANNASTKTQQMASKALPNYQSSGTVFYSSEQPNKTADQSQNIRLLPDGEMLIRSHQTATLSSDKLDSLVKELKKIYNKNINKLKINGSTVWISDLDVKSLSAVYTINLEY